MSVTKLSSAVGASEMTVRRDLDVLSATGVLERRHGGARTLLLRGEEPPFALRSQENVERKRTIAHAVADMIHDGESVVLDSGTTCLEVARLLTHRRLTVMTLSLHATNVLAASPNVQLLTPGGLVRAQELAYTGPLAETSISSLRFDTAVIGCCGLNAAGGLTSYDLADASIKRAAMRSAARVIAVADASKFSSTALGVVAPATEFDAVVTDDTAPEHEVAALLALGVAIRAVGVK